MPKFNLKNSNPNPLIDLLKQLGIRYKVVNKQSQSGNLVDEIEFFPRNSQQKNQLLSVLQNYGTQLYHNVSLNVDMNVENFFNYSSNQYENITRTSTELNLPLYYVENENEQNEKFKNLKALITNTISKSFIENISDLQQSLISRSQTEINKMRNILFGNEYQKVRSKKFLDEFCYYNRIQIGSQGTHEVIGDMLRKIKFQEEMFGGLISNNNTVDVGFNINSSTDETMIAVQDVLDIINNNPLVLDTSDKLILGSDKKTSSYITNNFKKYLLVNYLNQKKIELLKTFSQMYQNEECAKEFIIYKIEKYIDNDSQPLQTFWMFDEDWKEYMDYQIKRDKTYRYELKAYSIIYGTQTSIANITETNKESIKVDMTSSPSFKMAIVDFETVSIKVSPKIPLPPYVQFLNESNAGNYIKIYLDLDNDSRKEEFRIITEQDATMVQNIPTDDEGKIDFEYSIEDGKFEVFRLDEMPVSYNNFENAKTLDVRNKYSSTSVVYKENLLPNKKYYYMFRAVNFIGVPSNPSPVYEVELIKDASRSKIVSRVITLEKQLVFRDKVFKNLIQIRPAFQQEVFDDQEPLIQDLDTFKKKINQISLGTAIDKVWGKKFKIRVKSKDTGKIIDLNVKFNLSKDNI
tara:strand:- start:818 stop:2716 length:1899 start_codon:yes stop_codon:yes gene_type:complete